MGSNDTDGLPATRAYEPQPAEIGVGRKVNALYVRECEQIGKKGA